MASSIPTPPRGPHVVGLFATREQAEDALDELIARDFPSDQLSVVSAEGKPVSFPTPGEERGETAVRDTAIGVTLGASPVCSSPGRSCS
jgi:hypothetical protein